MAPTHRGHRQQPAGLGRSCSLRTLAAAAATPVGSGKKRKRSKHGTRRSGAAPSLPPPPPPLLLLLLLLFASASAQGWWKPGPGVSWQLQLEGEIDLTLDVDMYDIDLFDATIDEIGVLRDRDIVVICSFSAGTFEEDRFDADDFEAEWLGEEIDDGSTGERWLNITAEGLLSVMGARMDLAVNKTCDGVDPTSVQVFVEENTGFNTSAAEQLTYNTWLAGQAHDRSLSIGLRNDWPQLDELEPEFDWALSEDCLSKGGCEGYQTNFVAAGKAVLDVEFFQFDLAFCDSVTASGLDVIVKDLTLDDRRCSCQNPSTDIACDELLEQSPTVSADGSTSWVIGTAVGASLFVILVATLVSLWRRRKTGGGSGGSGGGDAGDDPMSGL